MGTGEWNDLVFLLLGIWLGWRRRRSEVVNTGIAVTMTFDGDAADAYRSAAKAANLGPYSYAKAVVDKHIAVATKCGDAETRDALELAIALMGDHARRLPGEYREEAVRNRQLLRGLYAQLYEVGQDT